jgi:simple sugar transport system ATP-binding protein
MSEYLLRMIGVCKAFAGVRALDHVNLEIKRSEVLCLAGENGSGKSTLIKAISGVYSIDEGIIELEGKPINGISPAEASRLGIQVIYQDLSIFPNLTVMENLSLNSEIANHKRIVSRKRMYDIARAATGQLNHIIDLNAIMGDLSIADKQAVAICRALVHNAKIIIMDEPTTALTKKEVNALFRITRDLQGLGIAVLFISHKLEEVFEIAQRVVILRNGRNVYVGLTSELDRKRFAYYMTGRQLEDKRYKRDVTGDTAVLEVQDLTLKSKYQNISFSVRKGEILGITGLLGCGRTELALTLFGIKRPDSGRIKLHGRAVRLNTPLDAQRSRIGYVPEDRLNEGLFLQQPIAANITATRISELSNKIGILNRTAIRKAARLWLDKLAIATDDPSEPVNTLSGGNQQRVVLAKWLANELDVLVLNGPTVGVDVGSKQDIHALLHELANNGLAVIIISDDLPEIVMNCSRVLIMEDGYIKADLPSDEIDEATIVEILR